MKCPKCGSENCQYITSYETHTKFFSILDACCCSFFLGPLGLLCGFCGSGSDTKTKEYWICNQCGEKFSPWKAQLNNLLSSSEKTEINENKKKVRFISESDNIADDISLDIWKIFKEYYNRKILGQRLETVVIVQNPTKPDDRLEKLIQRCPNLESKNVDIVCAVVDKEGFFIFKDGIAWKRDFIFFRDIIQINRCEDVLYINQRCIRVSNELAGDIFDLLCEILPNKAGKNIASYKEMLSILQNMEPEPSKQITHYSSMTEYAEYVKWELGNCMNYFSKNDLENYDEYITIRDIKEKIEKKIYFLCICLGIISGVIGLILKGITGLVLGVVVLGIIPCLIITFVTITEYWSGYKKELLPDDIYIVLEEFERIDLNKLGNISPVFYKNYLSDMYCEEQRYCYYCGNQLENGCSFCAYCGKK